MSVDAKGATIVLTLVAALAAAQPAFGQPVLQIEFDPDAQVAAELSPPSLPGFSFVPVGAARDGYYRLGDIDIRLRMEGEARWRDYSTALSREPVASLPHEEGVLSAADLSRTLPDTFPLTLERRWLRRDNELILRFTLTNPSSEPVELGGIGLAMAFDNILTGRTLAEAHEEAAFADPYPGRDAGYLQVTRLNGEGPALLVLPERGTPFLDYRPILDAERRGEGDGAACIPTLLAECMPRGHTFEGHYAWLAVSGGHFGEEWPEDASWNETSTIPLPPGASRSFGLRFVLSPSIRRIEETLSAHAHPVAVGIPGYVVPQDLPATLFVNALSPVSRFSVSPEGALEVKRQEGPEGWQKFEIEGHDFGQARLTFTYEDGTIQTLHYFVIAPLRDTVARLGGFLSTRHVLDDPGDPFGRDGGILTYDREADEIVTQDPRVWIAGMSDEGGAGAWLALIMKQLIAPDPEEAALFEDFYRRFIDGRLQYAEGPLAGGVRKSLFYYDPEGAPDGFYDPNIDWSSWASWGEEEAASVVRSFNYVHVAAAQWVLYRLARDHAGLVEGDWRDYLIRAGRTAVAMTRLAPRYAQFGQMEGDVSVVILRDLKRDGLTAEAAELERAMRQRTKVWRGLPYPFESEMPWDSTGQAEVHAWMRYFGHVEEADRTREVILAYDPLIPHWGYNGSARRFWDFLYAGKTRRIERQLHHYGSALNAVPLFADYREDPSDLHLLRVAYGGLMGSLTNVDEEGFASAAYHSFPDMRRFDAYSGDYGMGFFGHAFATASYLVDHEIFGWLAFGGLLEEGTDGEVVMQPRDSGRRRAFVAPARLWLELEAGTLEEVAYAPETGEVTLTLAPADPHTPQARLRAEATGEAAAYRPTAPLAESRGAFVIPLEDEPVTVTLVPAGR